MRSLGWTWLCLSPVLFLMAAISSVKSETVYYVQLACFGIVASAGLIGGVALLLGHSSGRRILQVLSWIGFAYFGAAALLLLFFHIVNAPEVTLASLAITALVAGVIGLTGVPFLYMARKLGNAQPGAPGDGPRPAGSARA